MERQADTTSEFLYESGPLGKLKIQIMSFMLYAEKIKADLKNANDCEDTEISGLIQHLEIFLKDFAITQQLADKMIIDRSDEERKLLFQKLPQIKEIFGWQDRVDMDGKIKEN